jgi:hypothetical protein
LVNGRSENLDPEKMYKFNLYQGDVVLQLGGKFNLVLNLTFIIRLRTSVLACKIKAAAVTEQRSIGSREIERRGDGVVATAVDSKTTRICLRQLNRLACKPIFRSS